MAESETPAKLEIVFSKALTLEIPSSEPTSVTSSPQSLSPTGVLDSSCATSASCSSLPIPQLPPLNVKFAPLPELAPRKRRSTAPLGMAARAQLVRRRRGYQQDPDQGPRYNAGTSPMWTEEELAEARMKQIAAAMEKERQRREQAGSYDPNDPLVVLGKKMKEASKQLWKKVSKKDIKEAAASPTTEKGEGEDAAKGKEEESPGNSSLDGKPPSSPVPPAAEVRNRCASSPVPPANSVPTPRSSTPVSSRTSTPIDPNAPLRSILISSPPPPPLPERIRRVEVVHQEEDEEEQGGVWEEEIDPHFPLNASQAETSTSFDSLSVSKRRSVMLNVSNFPKQSSSSSLTTDDCSTPTNANPDATLDAAAGQPPSTIQQNQGP